MTNIEYFLPMTRPHKLALLAYEGCQLLDVTGPAAVFGAANDATSHAGGRKVYDLSIVSPDGGLVTTSCGVALASRRIGGQPDTFLVAGGSRGLKPPLARDHVARWLRRAAPRPPRFRPACTRALMLAAAGPPHRNR